MLLEKCKRCFARQPALHAWEAKEKEAEAGEGANSPSSNLGIAIFDWCIVMELLHNKSFQKQALQLLIPTSTAIQGWKMPKHGFTTTQSKFLRSWEGHPQKDRLGPFDVMLKLFEKGWLRLGDPAEHIPRIWLEKHGGIFFTQKHRTSCAPGCPFGLQSFAPFFWNHRS